MRIESREDFIYIMDKLPKVDLESQNNWQIIPENRANSESLCDPLLEKTQLSCRELMEHIDKGKAILIDLRDREEINKTGAISGALNIPYLNIDKSLDDEGRLKNILDSGREVLFVDEYDERSSLTIQKINNAHRDQCFHLSHGMAAWKTEGYPIL